MIMQGIDGDDIVMNGMIEYFKLLSISKYS